MISYPIFRSFRIQNFRGLNEIEISDLRRINIVGGLNGSGKTTFLEAIFVIIDHANPISILKSLQWRNLPMTTSYAHDALFGRSKSMPVLIEAARNDSKIMNLSIEWGRQKVSGAPQQLNSIEYLKSNQTVKGDGFRISFRLGKNLISSRVIIDNGGGFLVGNENIDNDITINCIILSRYTINLQSDLSERYSYLISQGKKPEIIEILKMISPDCNNLEILQIAGVSILHALNEEGKLIPLSFAGDGVLTAVSVGLAIIQCENGIALLDEFDSSIHYTKLPEIWKIIILLARKYNCQVFSTTHSKEAIDAAMQSAVINCLEEDIAYFRFDRLPDRVVATKYTEEDLQAASSEYWEVR